MARWRSVGLVQGALSWMAGNDALELTHPFDRIKPDLLDETLIRRWIDRLKLDPDALAVADAEPAEAYPGTAMIITGNKFSAARFDNHVEVGGKPAFVVEASLNRLFVITDATCGSGPITVTVGADTVSAPHDFLAKPWPGPGSVGSGPAVLLLRSRTSGLRAGRQSAARRGRTGIHPADRHGPSARDPGQSNGSGAAGSGRGADDRRQHLRQRAHVLRPGQLRHARRAGRRHRLHRPWSTTPITITAPMARRAIPTSTRPSSTSSRRRPPRVRWIRALTWTTTA